MEAVTKQALRIAENLTVPRFQVIVMRANMGCIHCRQKVFQVISKMNGENMPDHELLELVVDVQNKQVILRGSMRTR